MTTSRLQLENLTCDFCADVIKRAIQSLLGVSECKVNLCMKQVVVEYDPQRTNLVVIQHALTSAGYASHPLDEPSKLVDECSNSTTTF